MYCAKSGSKGRALSIVTVEFQYDMKQEHTIAIKNSTVASFPNHLLETTTSLP